ncbi:MAG TPA: copper resistance CopC family protein, partial [Acidimicrobiales bacterium]
MGLCSTLPCARIAALRHPARRALTCFLAALVCAGVVFGLASPASAHASFVESEPADGARVQVAPSEVVLRFSEPVTIAGNAVRVINTDGDRVDDGKPRVSGAEVTIGLDGSLEPDTYIVAWRVVSADDHPVRGAVTFVVGEGPRASNATIAQLLGDEGDGPWPTIGAITRFLAYGGGFLVIGAVAWTVAVEQGVLRRPVKRLALLGAVIGAIGVLASVPVQAALSSGLGLDAITDTEIVSDVVDGPLGASVALVAVGLVLVAVVALGRSPRASLSA